MLKQDKFGQLYRKDPAGFNAAAEQEAKAILGPKVLEILGKTAPRPADPDPSKATPAPGKKVDAPKTYPVPTAAAINALKSRTDKDVASQQFDKIFGPGAASRVLGK
jgi:hypothetical protein